MGGLPGPGTLGRLVPFVLLLAFLVYPVVGAIVRGLVAGPGPSSVETLTSGITLRVFAFSTWQAVLSTVLSVVLGLPGAFLFARLRFHGRGLVRALLIVPFVLPPIVVVVGFIRMFGAYGIVDSVAMVVTGSSTTVVDLATGVVGIVLAHAFYNVPLVILMVSSSLERLDPGLEESAELLGAGTLQRLRHIVLPHILPSVAASAVLTFLFCFMSFPIVLSLGQGRYKTIEVMIYDSFRWFEYGRASTLAVVQVLVTMTLAVLYSRLATADGSATGRTRYARTVALGEVPAVLKALALVYVGVLVLLVAGPVAAVAHAAFYDPVSATYTLDGVTNMFVAGAGGGLLPLVNSVLYATLATLLAVALGIPLAYARRDAGGWGRSLVSMMVLLPLGVSSITIAYGLMMSLAIPLGLTTSPWPLIVIAQTVLGLPFTAKSIGIALDRIDPELLDQADSLGASGLQRLLFVELPLLAPGVLVGAVFAFAMAIGEMSATMFIALPQNYTLAVVIYRDLAVRKFVQAGAASLFLVAACVVSFLVIERLSEESGGGVL